MPPSTLRLPRRIVFLASLAVCAVPALFAWDVEHDEVAQLTGEFLPKEVKATGARQRTRAFRGRSLQGRRRVASGICAHAVSLPEGRPESAARRLDARPIRLQGGTRRRREAAEMRTRVNGEFVRYKIVRPSRGRGEGAPGGGRTSTAGAFIPECARGNAHELRERGGKRGRGLEPARERDIHD